MHRTYHDYAEVGPLSECELTFPQAGTSDTALENRG